MSAALTTRIPVKDREGRVIEEKEVATYAGLLARAHEEGLTSIVTRLVQVPQEDNHQVAIVEATVATSKGTFSGIGDADPGNVNRRVVAHLIRMAETRAKARALRDAVNIGVVSLEELGGEEEPETSGLTPGPAPRPAPAPRPPADPPPLREVPRPVERPRPEPVEARRPAPPSRGAPSGDGRPVRMTENQRRWLYRYLAERGFEGDAATRALCDALEVRDLGAITKAMASGLIDAWQNETRDAG